MWGWLNKLWYIHSLEYYGAKRYCKIITDTELIPRYNLVKKLASEYMGNYYLYKTIYTFMYTLKDIIRYL